MIDDLVSRLREGACLHNQLEAYDLTTEAADRIEELQDIIARIQYTNLRQDINAESRRIEIEKLCKGKPNE